MAARKYCELHATLSVVVVCDDGFGRLGPSSCLQVNNWSIVRRVSRRNIDNTRPFRADLSDRFNITYYPVMSS